jgi:hypothetical protein
MVGFDSMGSNNSSILPIRFILSTGLKKFTMQKAMIKIPSPGFMVSCSLMSCRPGGKAPMEISLGFDYQNLSQT